MYTVFYSWKYLCS